MAGKHVTIAKTFTTGTLLRAYVAAGPPEPAGSRIDRAYAEGRAAAKAGASAAANPHLNLSPAFNSPECNAWSQGHTAYKNVNTTFTGTQYQTATPDA